jgi:hypothetical protein
VSAQHRKPVVAFVLLACLAVAIVGIRAAEASRGVFLAAAVGAVSQVQGTIPEPSEADRRSAAERVAALGPAFAALNGDAATVTILRGPGTAVPARSATGATVAARGTATAVDTSRDDARPGTADRDVVPAEDATRHRASGPSARDGATRHRSHDAAARGPRRRAVAGPAPHRDAEKHRGAARTRPRDAGRKHRAGAAQRPTADSAGAASVQRWAGPTGVIETEPGHRKGKSKDAGRGNAKADGRDHGNGRDKRTGNGTGQSTRNGAAHRPGR